MEGSVVWDGIERRKGPSLFDRLLNFVNLGAWAVFVVALVLFHYARPEKDSIWHVRFNIEVRDYYLQDLTGWLQLSLYFCLLLTVVTLVMNRFRLKRKSDNKRYNGFILLAITTAFIAILATQI